MIDLLTRGYHAAPGEFVPAWVPTDEEGLVLWLKETSITQADNLVSLWEDLSASEADFAQATEANRPGVSAFLAPRDSVAGNTVASANLATASPLALAGAFEALFALYLPGNANTYFVGSADGSSGLLHSSFRALSVRLASANTSLAGNGAIPLETASVLSISRNASDEFYVEADSVDKTSAGPPTVAGTLAFGMLFGNTGLSFSPIVLGEVLVYDHQLAAPDRASAVAYLTGRWLS